MSGRSGYSWRDFDTVLSKLGWKQVTNRQQGFLAYQSEFTGQRIVIMKENNYNLDYFHKILFQLRIAPESFIQLAQDVENSV